MYRYVLYMHPEEHKRLSALLEAVREQKAKDGEIDDDFMALMGVLTRLTMMEPTFIA